MEAINNLYEAVGSRFNGRVQVASYNIYYDDAYDIRSHLDLIRWEAIPLPAIFIDEELVLSGRIDEAAILSALADRTIE